MLLCVCSVIDHGGRQKCGKNISDTLGCASCVTFLFLPHFDIICDLLLNRHTATWNLFVKLTFYQYSTDTCILVTVACITDIIEPWLVVSAEQRRYPCSTPTS